MSASGKPLSQNRSGGAEEMPADASVKLRWRIQPTIHQNPPLLNSDRIVQAQQFNCRAPSGSQADEARAVEGKMITPRLSARIEEQGDVIRQRIGGSQVGTFVVVTPGTGESQIAAHRPTAIFERNQVANLVRFRPVILMYKQYSQRFPARSMTSRRRRFAMRGRGIVEWRFKEEAGRYARAL